MKLCLPEDGNEQAVGWGFSKAWMRPRCSKNEDPQVGHLGLLVNGRGNKRMMEVSAKCLRCDRNTGGLAWRTVVDSQVSYLNI